MARGPRINWNGVDFSRPATEIAAELGCSVPAVYAAKRRLEDEGAFKLGVDSAPKPEPAPKPAVHRSPRSASLNQAKVIKALEAAAKGSREDFIFDFLRAYGTANTTVTRVKLGDPQRNLATVPGDIALRDQIYFRAVPAGTDLQAVATEIRALPVVQSAKIRFILVTDFKSVFGVDLKVDDQISFPFAEFKQQFEFFLPLTGLYEKAVAYSEHPADVKACEKMGRLYDGIRSSNKYESDEDRHGLNLFLTRLLFCFFAEDTGIFPAPNMMTDAFVANTQRDGTDADAFFRTLFEVLDMPKDAPDRAELPASFKDFPYVDGGLFQESSPVPQFNARTRQLLIDCGQMSWREISPAIFGSMFQAVMDPDERRALGAHYTSEANILKVIGPLFLDDLKEELNWILVSMQAGPAKKRKLAEYHEKLGRLQFLDPACGSGNFLIVAYREIRRLEIRCMAAMRDLEPGAKERSLNVSYGVKVHINHFHGIEILDFPCDVARVSLYLMEHMMNLEMEKKFGLVIPTIPLRYTPGIVCANALTTPWESIVKAENLDYIFGNPPFTGSSYMDKQQKAWMVDVFGKGRTLGMVDYVGCWFELASLAMRRNPHLHVAFVATNSICQGEQAGWLWKPLLTRGQAIRFAYRTFRWSNDAKDKAAVHCVIAGFDAVASGVRRLFSGGEGGEGTGEVRCKAISPYLIADSTVVVQPSSKSLSAPKDMVWGNKPTDGGHLIIENSELEDFKRREPSALPWIRRLVGAEELLHSRPRFCLWLVNAPEEVLCLPLIAERVKLRQKFLLASKAEATRAYAQHPHLFRQITQPSASTHLVFPSTSSERRPYIPLGYVKGDTIVNNSTFWEK